MEAHLTEIEVTGDRRGKIAAGIGFMLFIVLLLIPIFFHLNPPPGQPGISVLLAFDDSGFVFGLAECALHAVDGHGGFRCGSVFLAAAKGGEYQNRIPVVSRMACTYDRCALVFNSIFTFAPLALLEFRFPVSNQFLPSLRIAASVRPASQWHRL